MNLRKKLIAFLLSGLWISLSEFFRNELVFKMNWVNKFFSLNLIFPSEPLNGLLWIVWGFFCAHVLVFLSSRLRFGATIYCTWILTFPMMWLVLGNLNVMPLEIIKFAIPMSFFEVFIAVYICYRIMHIPFVRTNSERSEY